MIGPLQCHARTGIASMATKMLVTESRGSHMCGGMSAMLSNEWADRIA